MVLSIINMRIMSKCYNNWTKKFGLLIRITDAYLLCVLNPIVATTLQYVAIFCDILHMLLKMSAISIIAYPSIAALVIY